MINYIEHHGIKGQKWGIRRFQKNNASYKSMSDAELRNAVSRLSLERQYKELISGPKKSNPVSRLGKKYIDGLESRAINDFTNATYDIGKKFILNEFKRIRKNINTE